MVYFEKRGIENTDRALEIAFDEAKKRGLSRVVIASTRGGTALKAIDHSTRTGIKFLIITHNNWFHNETEQQFDAKITEKVEKAGGAVHSGTMVLRGLGRALRDKMGYSQEEIVALSLRMVSEGIKVCCEMAAMGCDSGLIEKEKDTIIVAGTGKGADTVCVMKPNTSNNFFSIRVKEILAKPSDV